MIKSLCCLTLFLLFVYTTSFAQEKNSELEIHEDWRLKKEKNGIQIFTRWLLADENRKARQMHAVMYLDANLSSIVKSLTDQEQVIRWLNRADTYYTIDSKDIENWHAYTRFNIPWPLDDQDLITENTLSRDPETGSIHVEIQGIKDYLPETDKVMRIPHFEGSWDFTPQSDGKVKIDYYVFVKSKPSLPRWIIDPVVEYGMWKTFSDFREVSMENSKTYVNLSSKKH